MHSNSDETADYGCGFCMSPSCVFNEISGGGDCPFYTREIGYGGDEIRERVSKLSEIPRGSPMLQEVSPCTESGMYTIEGILRDPEEFDKSAVFDPATLGVLLEAAPFQKMKWSPQLGYGMGHRADGSRVHLHSRGKIIIRKAPGRDEADRMFYSLTSLAQPALFSVNGGYTLWELLIMHYHGREWGSIGDHDPFLIWGQKDGDAKDILESSRNAFCDLDGRIGEEFRSQIVEILEEFPDSSGSNGAVSSLLQRLIGTWKDMERSGFDEPGQALGSRVFFLSVNRSVRGLENFIDQAADLDRDVIRDLIDRIPLIWSSSRSSISIAGLDIDILDSARGLMKCTYFLMPFGENLDVIR